MGCMIFAGSLSGNVALAISFSITAASEKGHRCRGHTSGNAALASSPHTHPPISAGVPEAVCSAIEQLGQQRRKCGVLALQQEHANLVVRPYLYVIRRPRPTMHAFQGTSIQHSACQRAYRALVQWRSALVRPSDIFLSES